MLLCMCRVTCKTAASAVSLSRYPSPLLKLSHHQQDHCLAHFHPRLTALESSKLLKSFSHPRRQATLPPVVHVNNRQQQKKSTWHSAVTFIACWKELNCCAWNMRQRDRLHVQRRTSLKQPTQHKKSCPGCRAHVLMTPHSVSVASQPRQQLQQMGLR